MDSNLTNTVIKVGSNDIADQAMRERRVFLLNTIQEAEDSGQQIPEVQFREMVSELFDLNIALGDAVIEDKDGDNG